MSKKSITTKILTSLLTVSLLSGIAGQSKVEAYNSSYDDHYNMGDTVRFVSRPFTTKQNAINAIAIVENSFGKISKVSFKVVTDRRDDTNTSYISVIVSRNFVWDSESEKLTSNTTEELIEISKKVELMMKEFDKLSDTNWQGFNADLNGNSREENWYGTNFEKEKHINLDELYNQLSEKNNQNTDSPTEDKKEEQSENTDIPTNNESNNQNQVEEQKAKEEKVNSEESSSKQTDAADTEQVNEKLKKNVDTSDNSGSFVVAGLVSLFALLCATRKKK